MKTKRSFLLLAVICCVAWNAEAQPASWDDPINPKTNSVAFPPGRSLVGNPLFHFGGTTAFDTEPDNTVATLFSNAQPGAEIFKFDSATHRFSRRNVFRRGGWSRPYETLVPGDGAFLFNPPRRSWTVAFTGHFWYGTVSVPNGISLISSPGPGLLDFGGPLPPQPPLVIGSEGTFPFPGTPTLFPRDPSARSGIDFNAQEGDVVYTFRNGHGGFQRHVFVNGEWDRVPEVGIGQACFILTTEPRDIRSSASPPV